MSKLAYSSGIVHGCYYSIEPSESSDLCVNLITPFSKRTAYKNNVEDAKSWIDQEVRNYLSHQYYYREAD